VGSSICGASAAVAAGAVVQAEEKDVTLAVALCGVLGAAGALFYVLAGPALALSTRQLAILAGASLHEVAQVMAAAFTWGQASGDLGTLVKLTRVVLLAPTLLVLGLGQRHRGVRYSFAHPPVPWFVIGFLLAGVASTVGLVPTAARSWLASASVYLMATAMAAMGLHTDLGTLRRAGFGVVRLGLVGFAGLALLAWSLIHLFRL
jgi:uncharacterized integral membrane protein (TIGR00698 family)